ncbi:MAG: NADH-quinone oxidoreductase subunit NuoE [Spirochaetes bacterium]|nr:NADH-quinone oxidoreductase subunit NuoE [Spirochaetota bacterium]
MKIDLSKLNKVITKYSTTKGTLIPILQETQKIYGFLPKEVMENIANSLNLTTAEVYGVATFYTQFHLRPVGKHVIKVCHGTACHVGGANILDEMLKSKLGISIGETTKDELFTIFSVACLGCCSLAPVVMINNKTYGKLTNEKFSKIIDQYIALENKETLND